MHVRKLMYLTVMCTAVYKNYCLQWCDTYISLMKWKRFLMSHICDTEQNAWKRQYNISKLLPWYANQLTQFWFATSQIVGFLIRPVTKQCIVLAPNSWCVICTLLVTTLATWQLKRCPNRSQSKPVKSIFDNCPRFQSLTCWFFYNAK